MPKKIGAFRKLPAIRGEVSARSKAVHYAFSLLIFAVALVLRFWLEPILPPGFPFLTFFPAVVIAGFVFGVSHGMVVAILSGAASWYFFIAPDDYAFSPGTLMAMALYLFVVATDLFLLSLMMSAYRAEMLARRDVEQMAEEREVLSRELDHRLKNVFATINAVITLSERHADTAAELAQKLKDRLNAMAQASLLLRGSSERGPTTLSSIIEMALAPFDTGERNRFKLAGPKIIAAGQTSVVLGLILHELGTNAAKYGALTTVPGQVLIRWSEVRSSDPESCEKLEIVWQETKGPAPAASEPEQKGFGSTLIPRVIAMLDGEARFEFPNTGAIVTMIIPLAAIAGMETNA